MLQSDSESTYLEGRAHLPSSLPLIPALTWWRVFKGTCLYSDGAGSRRVWWINTNIRYLDDGGNWCLKGPLRYMWVKINWRDMDKHCVAGRSRKSQPHWRGVHTGIVDTISLNAKQRQKYQDSTVCYVFREEVQDEASVKQWVEEIAGSADFNRRNLHESGTSGGSVAVVTLKHFKYARYLWGKQGYNYSEPGKR